MRKMIHCLPAMLSLVLLAGMPVRAQEVQSTETSAPESSVDEEGSSPILTESEEEESPLETMRESESPDGKPSADSSDQADDAILSGQEETSWAEKTAILDAVSVGLYYLQGGTQLLADGLSQAMTLPEEQALECLVAYDGAVQEYGRAAVNSLTYAIDLCGSRADAATMKNSLTIYRNILSAFLLEPQITPDTVLDYPADAYLDHASELVDFIIDISWQWVNE